MFSKDIGEHMGEEKRRRIKALMVALGIAILFPVVNQNMHSLTFGLPFRFLSLYFIPGHISFANSFYLNPFGLLANCALAYLLLKLIAKARNDNAFRGNRQRHDNMGAGKNEHSRRQTHNGM